MLVWTNTTIETDHQHFYRSLEFGGWWAGGTYTPSPQLKESLRSVTGDNRAHTQSKTVVEGTECLSGVAVCGSLNQLP